MTEKQLQQFAGIGAENDDAAALIDGADGFCDGRMAGVDTAGGSSLQFLPQEWRRGEWINAGWKFLRIEDPADESAEIPPVDSDGWETVVLPHTARVGKRDERFPFQGICWYARQLVGQPRWKGKKVYIRFEAAMQIADVWVNGVRKLRHLGGYLPFTIDLSDDLIFNGSNTIAVRLDNRDTDECPPGKPTEGLDFNYPGGLYRGVELVVCDPVHISDPVAAGEEAGGGIFIQCKDVSRAKAFVMVRTHVVNNGKSHVRRCSVLSILRDQRGMEVATARNIPVMIAGNGSHRFSQCLEVIHPELWHPDRPYLYRLESHVLLGNTVANKVETRVGIRTFSIDRRLMINGKEFRVCGSNRHQEYPHLEYALSPNAAYRDARKIRDGGFNFIRLSHYPQDTAFLDACDELGILVQAAVPGWQHFSFNDSFIRQSFQDIRDLIRRDRNHPCIVFWEPNLNETDAGQDDWQRAAHEIAHWEFPGNECFTFGDPYPAKTGWSWDVDDFTREYGDFGFGGNESTSRHLRGEGEQALLQQAWNYQWCINDMSKAYADPSKRWLGCATWVMFDYNRGYYHKPCTCGMMDIFRLPKFVYYFFQSQRNPRLFRDDVESGPMLFVAHHWRAAAPDGKVVVYSNCEEVELSINGRVIRRQKPDSGPDTPYSRKEFDYATVGDQYDASGGNPFDGGNCRNLEHPPFTFLDVPFQAGVLEAVGYIDGEPVATHKVRTPEAPLALKLEVDFAGRSLAADGADCVFLRACVIDAHGTVVPCSDSEITFSVHGPASLVGANPVHAEAGIASVLLQAALKPGAITVTASANGLSSAETSVISDPVCPA